MAPKKLQPGPPETNVSPQTHKGETASLDLDAVFREAVASGEISGDTVMLDEQGQEVKDPLPRKTIFDL